MRLQNLANGYEDTILFCGEHLSVHHGWIVGSLNSAGIAVGQATRMNKDDPLTVCHFLSPKKVPPQNGCPEGRDLKSCELLHLEVIRFDYRKEYIGTHDNDLDA